MMKDHYLFSKIFVIVLIIGFLTSACTKFNTCEEFCVQQKFSNGSCDVQPVNNNLCAGNKIFRGVSEDCKPDLGVLGIEKGCCCKKLQTENETNLK